jgi:hypothetical protein
MKEIDSIPKPILKHEPLAETSHADEALAEKMVDAMTPGFEAEFDPDEAERVGAFTEDALSEADALDSCIDLDGQD